MGDNPLGFLFGLGSNALFALDTLRQQQEARGSNEALLKGGLDLFLGQGGVDTSSFNIPSIAGHQLRNPYDAMGGSRQFQNDMTSRFASDWAGQKNEFGRFSDWLNSATGSRESRLLGEYDRGAGGVLGYAGDRVGSTMGLLRSGLGDVQNRMGARSQEALSGYANAFQDSYGQLQDRYARGMANLEGMGEQARKDINTQYKANEGRISADLAARGLGNTTVRQNLLQGNLREKMDTTGRLDESLRQQRLATDAALSGDVAAAKGADALNWSNLISGLRGDEATAAANATGILGNAYSGLTGDVMSTMGNLFGNRMNLSTGLSGQTLDTAAGLRQGAMGINDAYRQNVTNLAAQQGAYRMDLGNQANANYMNTLLGTSFGYPSMSAYDIMSAFGSGRGGLEATTDAMNLQKKQFNQALTMGALGMGMAPLGSLAGGFGGGLGYGMGSRWGGGGWGGNYSGMPMIPGVNA